MDKQELVDWLTVQAQEAVERRDSINHETSPRAYGYWDGVHGALILTLRNLTGSGWR